MEYVQPIRDVKQIEKMKKVLRKSNLRDHCLFVVGINSGLRISDLLSLTLEDVLSEDGEIRDRVTVREQKTNKTKDFPLGDTAKKAIEEYLEIRSEFYPDSPLFLSKKGGVITRQQAWRVINDAARDIGITDNIGTHTMRKTFGYHAYLQGVDVTRIQQLLNHSSPSVTLRYIGITQDDLDGVYLNLNL